MSTAQEGATRAAGRLADEERLSRAALVRAAEPGDPRWTQLVEHRTAITVVSAVLTGTEPVDALGTLQRRLTSVDGAAELARGAAGGARFVVPGDSEWPAGLSTLAAAAPREGRGGVPFGLWIRGPADIGAWMRRSVAVVGSRAATGYGEHVAGELGADLGERGCTVVSGAAYGIDAAAHRGALAVSGPTVAVLACGVDVAYPRAHAALLDRIAAEGAVVSECAPGEAPTRARFLARNRLIAAMTRGVVVVEAAPRSGALSTARWADSLSRPVLGVPGPVTSALSAGVHAAVRDGLATLVTGAAEVLDGVGDLGEDTAALLRGPGRAWDGLPPDAAVVLDRLPGRGTVSVDRLLHDTGLPLSTCLAALSRLQLGELAEPTGDEWQLGAAMRAARRRGDA